MIIGMAIIASTFIYAFLIAFVYISKKHIKSNETQIYNIILCFSLVNLIIEFLLCINILLNVELYSFFNLLLNRLFLISLFSWFTIFTIYIVVVSGVMKMNQTNKIRLFIYYFIVCGLLVILPLELINENGVAYSIGIAPYLIYFVCIIYSIIWLIIIVKCKHKLGKKAIPFLVFLFCFIIMLVLRAVVPGLLLNSFSGAFATILMYFTIENPDMHMIDELYRNKSLVERSYEDKSNFLFELTQEVRNPLFNISNVCNSLKEKNNVEELQEGVKVINSYIKQLDFVVNDVLNVSSLDAQRIKFVNTRYNVKNMYDEIVSKINSCKPDSVEFRSSISNNIPYLYGDSIKLKQIILSILLNSIKKTENGFIEFKINTIERYDVCRLIIIIRDSSGGISIDKINEILSSTGELDQDDIKNMEKLEINMQLCQKIIKLLGGNLMIKSNPGKGTESILTIDQRIKIETNESILQQYEYYLKNIKKVLIVSQNKDIVNILKKKFNIEKINYSVMLYGKDAVDKIKSGKRYDYILVDDEMNGMSGYTTLQELKQLENFDIPVIILLSKLKENIKDHYISDGFSDYLLIDNISNEIERIINKY